MADGGKLELVIQIDARDANASVVSFNRGIDQMGATAAKATRAAGGGFESMTASIAKGVVVGQALFEVGRRALQVVRNLTIGAIENADAMGKQAQKIGVTVEEMSEMKHISDLSGNSLEQLSTAVGVLSKNMLSAAQGGKEQKKTFELLDVAVKNNDGTLRSANAVLADLADRFKAMPDGATKTALAMQALGRSGKEMIPFLNGGGEALRDAAKEAHEFGRVISEDTFRAAEQFNDNLSRLKGAAEGVGLSIAEPLLPELNNLTNALVDYVKAGNAARETTSGLTDVMNFAALVVARAAVEWKAFHITIQQIDVALVRAGNKVGIFSDQYLADLDARLKESKRQFYDLYDLGVKIANFGDRPKLGEGFTPAPSTYSRPLGPRRPSTFNPALEDEEAAKTANAVVDKVAKQAKATRDLIFDTQQDQAKAARAHIANLEKVNDAHRDILIRRNSDEAAALGVLKDINRDAALANLNEWDRSIQQQAFAYEDLVDQLAALQQRGLISATEFNDGLANLAVKAAADVRKVLADQDKQAADTAKQLADDAQQRAQKVFDGFKRSAEGVFDALITRGRSVWDVFKTAALTALKEIVTSSAARAMMQLFGGGGGAGSGQSAVGSRGGILGALGAFIPGLGGLGSAGAPGGTGGFAGPVAGAAGAVAAPGGFGPAGGGAGFAGLFGAGGVAGAAGTGLLLGGPLAGLGIGKKIGGGLGGAVGGGIAATGALAGLGLLSGLGIGAAFGPVGLAIVGGAIGVGALVGAFRKSPEEKVAKAIKQMYAVDIQDKGVLKQIYEITRGFGSISLGLSSPQVRELVELYALGAGQQGNFPKRMQPVSLSQSGSGIYSQPTWTNGMAGGGPMSISPGGQTITIRQEIPVLLDGAPVQRIAMETILKNGRVISQAVLSGTEASAGRRQLAAQLNDPFELVR